MTDQRKDLPELTELDALDELPELEELETLEELEELDELPEMPEQALAPAEAPTPEGAPAEAKKPARVQPSAPKPAPVKRKGAAKPEVGKAAADKPSDREKPAVTAASTVPPLEDLPEKAPAAAAQEGGPAPEEKPAEEVAAAAGASLPLEEIAGASTEAGESTPKAAQPAGQKRELEQAPIELRKASMILLGGSILPWMIAAQASEIPWAASGASKAVALVAAWLFHQGYVATHGGQAVGFIQSMARIHKAAVPAIAGVVAIISVVVAFQMWPEVINTDTQTGALAGLAEIATLLLATCTISHIFGYEHGGKFNPIFPLMFLGPGIAGIAGAFRAFSNNPIGGIGNLVVAAGGLMAIHVMYVSMKQAKIEGDLKREAMREQRKAQRAAARSKRGK